MKKLYVIVEYDIDKGNYKECAVDGIVFESKKTAEEYMFIKPNHYNMDVEELDLYREN